MRRPLLVLADLCRERGRGEAERLLGPRTGLLAAYEPALADLPGLEAYRAAAVAPLPPEEARLRLFHALTETFAALAQPGAAGAAAVLLVLDDLQWTDELTLGLLEFLAQNEGPRKLRLLAVGTYRTEEVGARRDSPLQRLIESMTRAAGGPHLQLERLGQRAVGSMVADMLAMPAPPELFVDFLTRQSEGNAFFVAEYLRTAIARDVLYRGGDGNWQVAEPGPEEATEAVFEALPLPGSVRSLVERRLEGLGPGALRQAEAAAVLGREVDEELAGRLVRLGGVRRMEAIQELVSREVLEEASAGRLRFAHDKIREVAYERIPPARRRRLHRAAAQGMAALRRDEDLASLARHWDRAGEPEKARPCYLQAARRARTVYALAEAEGLYRAYLERVSEPGVESVQARNELAHAVLYRLGRNQESLAELDRALEEAKSCGDAAGQQDAWTFRSEVAWRLGRPMEANKTAAEQALEMAQRLGDVEREAKALTVLGRAEVELGHSKQAEQAFEQARRKVQGTEHRLLEALALANLGILHRRQRRLAQAQGLFEESLEILREIGSRPEEGRHLGNLGGVHLSLGNLRQASELMEQGLKIHREVGDLRSEATVLLNLGRLRWLQGEPEEVRGLLEGSLALSRKMGFRSMEGAVLRQLADLEQQLACDLERAEALLGQAESVHEAEGVRLQVALCRCQFGHLELARGRTARPFLLQAEDLGTKLAARWPDLDDAVNVLRQTTEAFEAGRALFRGHLWENLPERMQCWLIRQGHTNGGSSLF